MLLPSKITHILKPELSKLLVIVIDHTGVTVTANLMFLLGIKILREVPINGVNIHL